MSSLKTNTVQKKRGMLNTTIEMEVFDKFRVACKETGIPMNMILETFMRQFCEGEFKLKFANTNKLEVELME